MKHLAVFTLLVSTSVIPALCEESGRNEDTQPTLLESKKLGAEAPLVEGMKIDPRYVMSMIASRQQRAEQHVTELFNSAQGFEASKHINEASSCYTEALKILRANNSFKKDQLEAIQTSVPHVPTPDATSYEKVQSKVIRNYCRFLRKQHDFARFTVLEKEFGKS